MLNLVLTQKWLLLNGWFLLKKISAHGHVSHLFIIQMKYFYQTNSINSSFEKLFVKKILSRIKILLKISERVFQFLIFASKFFILHISRAFAKFIAIIYSTFNNNSYLKKCFKK